MCKVLNCFIKRKVNRCRKKNTSGNLLKGKSTEILRPAEQCNEQCISLQILLYSIAVCCKQRITAGNFFWLPGFYSSPGISQRQCNTALAVALPGDLRSLRPKSTSQLKHLAKSFVLVCRLRITKAVLFFFHKNAACIRTRGYGLFGYGELT